MRSRVRDYPGEKLDVHYDVLRCIHAEECIHRLSAVFDKDKRPWIQPAEGEPDVLMETIVHCPSGALHYTPKGDAAGESHPAANTVTLVEDGPLYVHGQVAITAEDGTNLLEDTRVALCRCRASKNKPLCDNTHQQINFRAPTNQAFMEAVAPLEGGAFTVEPTLNGSLHVKGAFSIQSGDGQILFQGEEAWLCRCGGSGNKPFCDGTHKKIGFISD